MVRSHEEAMQTERLCTNVRVDLRFTSLQQGVWSDLQSTGVFHTLQGL
jgi:hypothetical protein